MNHRDDGKLGAEAFGTHPEGKPTGAAAFGEGDAEDPLRGALLFGNDPRGAPTGSESFGNPDEKNPLRGALLFGNDPRGAPTGSESFGTPDEKNPLRGALLFGNDPKGFGRGSEAFGTPEQDYLFKGASAVGAPQLFPKRLYKDAIGYDFAGVMLATDTMSLSGIKKDPRNRLRERILRVLARRLAMEPERMRHGVNEHAIPWGRLRRDKSLDKGLAEALRAAYSIAPGSVLGIEHVRDILASTERMHSFDLHAEWDIVPVKMTVSANDKPVAYAISAMHNAHRFFVFKSADGEVLAYVDAIRVERDEQRARIRTSTGETVATFELVRAQPREGEVVSPNTKPETRLAGILRDTKGREVVRLEEERSSAQFFRAKLFHVSDDEDAGALEDVLKDGKIRTRVELDLNMPRAVAWGLAAVMGDLARLRRRGWPDKPVEQNTDGTLESIEEALGPRRRS